MLANNLEHLKKIERKLTILRWIVLMIMAPSFFFLSDYQAMGRQFSIAVMIALSYNLFVTISAFSQKDRFIPFLKYTIYIDVMLITAIIAIRGGLRSDIYFLYFLAISYNGAKLGYRGTVVTLLLSIVSFTITSLHFTDADAFSTGRFLIRLVYLPLISLSIAEMNMLIQDSHSREKKAHDLACTDPLTGLPNRLLLTDNFEKMIQQHIKTGVPFSIILFDLDDFKKINDTKGHTLGDEVLVSLTNILKKHTISRDFACRLGGEEFLILFANTDLETAYLRANHIRREVSTHKFNKIGRITVSGGINLYQPEFSIIENINFADEAMYAAKGAGKNQVMAYQELGAEKSS